MQRPSARFILPCLGLLVLGSGSLHARSLGPVAELPALGVHLVLEQQPDLRVDVQVTVVGELDGETVFAVSEDWGGVPQERVDLQAPEARGAAGQALEVHAESSLRWTVRHAPGERVTFGAWLLPALRRVSGDSADHYRPLLEPELFQAIGHVFLPLPERVGQEDEPLALTPMLQTCRTHGQRWSCAGGGVLPARRGVASAGSASKGRLTPFRGTRSFAAATPAKDPIDSSCGPSTRKSMHGGTGWASSSRPSRQVSCTPASSNQISMKLLQFGSSRGAPKLLLGLVVLGGLVLGCRTANDRDIFLKAMRSNIDDADRRTEIQAVFERRGDHQDAFLNEVSALRDRLQDAIANINAKPEDADSILLDFDKAWVGMRDEVIDGSLELRGMMSEEEWGALADLDATTIVSRSVTLHAR